jgi:hypothetical protein
MKPTKPIIEKLFCLEQGETLALSSMNKSLVDELIQCEVVMAIPHGRNKTLRAVSSKAVATFVADRFNIDNLSKALDSFSKSEMSRAEQVAIGGDSKIQSQRTFKGFLVNCYQPIKVFLCNREITLIPFDGSYTFIYDYEKFVIPEDIIVMGIENSENFRWISRQKYLFDKLFPSKTILFVSRYPQNQSKDLVNWLQSIPNEYIHFGDLDLAGVNIFLSEFYSHLGLKSSFLIPEDYDERIASGSRERYKAQYPQYQSVKIPDPRVQPVVDSIHRHHRGYDQEGYII